MAKCSYENVDFRFRGRFIETGGDIIETTDMRTMYNIIRRELRTYPYDDNNTARKVHIYIDGKQCYTMGIIEGYLFIRRESPFKYYFLGIVHVDD